MILNNKQKEAVEYIDGPCLVIAGAGSGKTRVITEKIVHLIKNCGYNSKNIYALTFTNKAAKEMKERASLSLSPEYSRNLHISTFHSLCLDILKEEYITLNLKRNFTLIDEHDQINIMIEVLEKLYKDKNLERDELKDKAKYWLNLISNCKNKQKFAEDIEIVVDDDWLLKNIYSEYEILLRSYNSLDFDDLILFVCYLFKVNRDILSKWRDRIKYLLVDEYQDTNTSQYLLIKQIVAKHGKFTVVGDDDQSIYAWRGACPENIGLLQTDFPSLRVIMLEQNYRSKGRILNCANKLIENNNHIFQKNLFSQMDYGKKIKVIEIPTSVQEGKKVVADLMAHHYIHSTSYNDYAILYRSNHQSKEIQKALLESNIPFKVIGDISFFSQSEIKDMMSYLRIISNDEDDKAFLRIVNIPRRSVGAKTIQKLQEYAILRNESLFQASLSCCYSDKFKSREINTLLEFSNLIQTIRDELKLRTSEKLEEYIKNLSHKIGYDNWIVETSASEKNAFMRQENVNTLLGWIVNSVMGTKDLDPITFEEAVRKLSTREMLDRNEQDFELEEVQLLTLHSSKGLEFPYVYIIGVEEGILPHQNSIDIGDIEEERRLAYVGITRAKSELVLTYCAERNKKDKKKNTIEPSRFLFELPKEDLDWVNSSIVKRDEEEEEKHKKEMLDAIFDLLNNS